MTHLHDLPEDILLPILHGLLPKPSSAAALFYEPRLGYLSKFPRRDYLSNFALASKPLLPFTQKILYSAFSSSRCRQTWKIRAFLRTLIANPCLASHVQHLHLLCWRAWDRESDDWDRGIMTDRYEEGRQYTPAWKTLDKKLFRKAICELALTDKQGWRDALMKDVDEVYVALLILLCPNVAHLEVCVPRNPVFIDKALDHATLVRPEGSMLTPSLRNLKQIFYYYRGDTTCLDFSHVVPLFRLTSVQDLSLYNVSAQGSPPLLTPNITLKRLRMQDVDLDGGNLSTIIPSLKALEGLYYVHLAKPRHDTPGHSLQLDLLGGTLNSVATLQELDLIVHGLGSGVLGSLRGCSRLRRLNMLPYNLLSFGVTNNAARLIDVLPSSLEELSTGLLTEISPLSGKFQAMIDQVCEVVNESPTRFTALHMIRLRSYLDGIPTNIVQLSPTNDLVGACGRHNVALEDLALR